MTSIRNLIETLLRYKVRFFFKTNFYRSLLFKTLKILIFIWLCLLGNKHEFFNIWVRTFYWPLFGQVVFKILLSFFFFLRSPLNRQFKPYVRIYLLFFHLIDICMNVFVRCWCGVKQIYVYVVDLLNSGLLGQFVCIFSVFNLHYTVVTCYMCVYIYDYLFSWFFQFTIYISLFKLLCYWLFILKGFFSMNLKIH